MEVIIKLKPEHCFGFVLNETILNITKVLSNLNDISEAANSLVNAPLASKMLMDRIMELIDGEVDYKTEYIIDHPSVLLDCNQYYVIGIKEIKKPKSLKDVFNLHSPKNLAEVGEYKVFYQNSFTENMIENITIKGE